MRFLISIYNNDQTDQLFASGDVAELEAAHAAVQAELRASGELIDTKQLSEEIAKVVRVPDDSILVTDGPFSETKEWVGGYYLVECDGVDRAVAIAARFVEGRSAPVEVRAVV
jgi:hypothetical protein